ncbi:glutathione S-transferase family protein [Muricoccus vinaceus]|uniref:Uncharacterized protein n=1 Tax=Muricoccus vinaceus TaxID=424704 RepID=A0ABV6IRD9_9PROT
MFESGAIILRTAARGGELIPADPRARIKASHWLVSALDTVEPAVVECTINKMSEASRSWFAERRPVVLGSIEERPAERQARLRDRPWLEGKAVTVGNLMMISVLGGLRGTGLLDRFPTPAACVARGEGRSAYRKAMADHLTAFEQPAAA